MTPAERRFKKVVIDLVFAQTYPSPRAIRKALGRAVRGPMAQGGDVLDGRETRWRRQVLGDLGWTEAAIRPGVKRPRRAWTPPGVQAQPFCGTL